MTVVNTSLAGGVEVFVKFPIVQKEIKSWRAWMITRGHIEAVYKRGAAKAIPKRTATTTCTTVANGSAPFKRLIKCSKPKIRDDNSTALIIPLDRRAHNAAPRKIASSANPVMEATAA